jgi:hypothetical protein
LQFTGRSNISSHSCTVTILQSSPTISLHLSV